MTPTRTGQNWHNAIFKEQLLTKDFEDHNKWRESIELPPLSLAEFVKARHDKTLAEYLEAPTPKAVILEIYKKSGKYNNNYQVR